MGQSSVPGKRFLSVHVSPAAKRSEITGFKAGVLQVKLAALPREGKANEALVDFLSARLRVRKTAITIVRGHLSRNKVIAVTGMGQREIIEALGLADEKQS